jgi:Toprim-like
MPKKIRCPLHDDSTASLALYPSFAYCFGGCGRLELSALSIEGALPTIQIAEDVVETFRYIDSLPLEFNRGFPFRTDSRGFYITWPDRSFYKKRIFEPGDGPKYIGPRGVQPPPFWARILNPNAAIMVVEGELNALAVMVAFPECSVVSFGSASEFSRPRIKEFLINLYKRANLCIVLDDDPAGLKAAIEVAKGKSQDSVVCLMGIDANELLLTKGAGAIRTEIEKGIVG